MDSASAAPVSEPSSSLGITVLRIALGLIFLSAGILKGIDPGRFLIAIRSYQLLADPWAALLTVSLPWLEILTGLCLVLRRFYHAALVLSGGMLGMFLGAIFSGLSRGLEIDCGCFTGTPGKESIIYLIIRDLLLLLMLAGLVRDACPSFRKKSQMPE